MGTIRDVTVLGLINVHWGLEFVLRLLAVCIAVAVSILYWSYNRGVHWDCQGYVNIGTVIGVYIGTVEESLYYHG